MIDLSSACHTAVANNLMGHFSASVARKNILLVYYGVKQLKRLVKQLLVGLVQSK